MQAERRGEGVLRAGHELEQPSGELEALGVAAQSLEQVRGTARLHRVVGHAIAQCLDPFAHQPFGALGNGVPHRRRGDGFSCHDPTV